MPAEIVHPITPDLLDPMYAAAMRAYLTHDGGLSAPWRRRSVDLDRTWVAREHGRVVGTLRSIDGTVSVPAAPGRDCPAVDADLLSLVSVAPTHRRQGLLTRMLGQSLTEAHDRGLAVSVLVAAEYGIYGRFGYAPAAFETTFEIDQRHGVRIAAADPVGSWQEIDEFEASELAPPVYDAEARARAGLIGRDEVWWDRELRRVGEERAVVPVPDTKPPRHVVHRGVDGAVDGYVRWSVLEDDEHGRDLGRLHVHEVLAADPVAYRELWRFLFGIDLVDRLHYPQRPADDPLPWLLTDARAAAPVAAGDAMWLRVLDVPAALSARGYPVEEELVLEVEDSAVGGWAAGRWLLQTGPDGASCRAETGRSPDLTLPQTTLASLYLGGVRGAQLARLGRLSEHTPGAADRLDRLFATPFAPWRGTDF